MRHRGFHAMEGPPDPEDGPWVEAARSSRIDILSDAELAERDLHYARTERAPVL